MLVSGDHPAFAFLHSPEATAARADELDQHAAAHRKMGHERLADGYAAAARRLRERKKPPIGLMPQVIWHIHHPRPSTEDLRERLAEIDGAVMRYHDEGMDVPLAWRTEALEVAGKLKAWEAISCPPT